MKIALIMAMDIEYRKMCDVLGGKPQGTIGANEIILWQCGVGKVNAAVGTMELIQQHHPDCIISTGLAGGIDSSLHVMDIVASTRLVYHDVDCGSNWERGQMMGMPTFFDADPQLLQKALSLDGVDGMRVVGGLMCTGDQFITSREGQAAIKRNFPEGLACEMESTAIAHTCFLSRRTQGTDSTGIPFLAVRVISDTPGNTDNHQQQWEDFLASMGEHSFHFVKKFLEKL